jgi:hypothetical protein
MGRAECVCGQQRARRRQVRAACTASTGLASGRTGTRSARLRAPSRASPGGPPGSGCCSRPRCAGWRCRSGWPRLCVWCGCAWVVVCVFVAGVCRLGTQHGMCMDTVSHTHTHTRTHEHTQPSHRASAQRTAHSAQQSAPRARTPHPRTRSPSSCWLSRPCSCSTSDPSSERRPAMRPARRSRAADRRCSSADAACA